ncbi:MAG: hypothetical protein WCD42_05395 [Rhizomicrobium sp.]
MGDTTEQDVRNGGLRFYSAVLGDAERLVKGLDIPMVDALRMERCAILYAAELITARIASEGSAS